MASILPRNTSQGIVCHARVRTKGAPAQSSIHERATNAVKWARSVERHARHPESQAPITDVGMVYIDA